TLTLHHAVRSDVGHVREGNEDAGYAGYRIIAVADGMGGQAAGEVASRVVIARLAALDEDAVGPDLVGSLQAAVLTANQDLREMVAAEPDLEGMGTTVTAVLAAGERLALVHIGDSRCYLYRDRTLVQITHDHTFVQSLVDGGQLTPDEAAAHPQRSLLTRALDGREGVQLDISIREAQVGDRYLLCTDGLSGVVASDTIATALDLTKAEQAVEQLVELALRGGGPDNITVVVADVVDDEEAGASPTIAGAAAEGPEPVRAPASTAAARAALAAGQPERARRWVALPPARAHQRHLRWGLLLPVLVVLALVAGLVGTWVYIQHQYFVGVAGSRVAIFQGVEGQVGPLHLSRVRVLAMPVDLLLPYYQQKVREGIGAKSLADAERIVASLSGQEVHPTGPRPAPTSTTAPTPAPTPAVTPSPQPSSRAP
ncbi:MAG: PP2C family protein-serine/threonine phosphatase, partial [Mycobacteriales bacterium]